MTKRNQIIDSAISQEYEYGFTTDIEQETIPPGLNEDVIRLISSKKDEPEWLLDWRLKAYNQWLKMDEPNWSKLNYPNIDFQAISYYAAPKEKEKLKSLDEVDPELLDTYNKLGILTVYPLPPLLKKNWKNMVLSFAPFLKRFTTIPKL